MGSSADVQAHSKNTVRANHPEIKVVSKPGIGSACERDSRCRCNRSEGRLLVFRRNEEQHVAGRYWSLLAPLAQAGQELGCGGAGSFEEVHHFGCRSVERPHD
jgi:hypothetical protein